MIEASINASNIKKGIDIVNAFNETFITKNIEYNNQKAMRAISFIDDRLEAIDGVLDINKTNLKNFQQDNSSLDVDLEVQQIIENISKMQSEINRLNIEITKAETIYTSNNPIYINLQKQRDELYRQKEIIEASIKNLPAAKQKYIDLYRDFRVSEDLYTELINRKLGFSISAASTIGNTRVVDDAYLKGMIKPRFLDLLLGFFLSFVITVIITLVRGLLYISIKNPAEIEDNGIKTKILGVIPHEDEEEPYDEISDQMISSLESTIVNIESNINDKLETKSNKANIICLTSPTASNGKTRLSYLFSKKLSLTNKKVLLIDADFKEEILIKGFLTLGH